MKYQSNYMFDQLNNNYLYKINNPYYLYQLYDLKFLGMFGN